VVAPASRPRRRGPGSRSDIGHCPGVYACRKSGPSFMPNRSSARHCPRNLTHNVDTFPLWIILKGTQSGQTRRSLAVSKDCVTDPRSTRRTWVAQGNRYISAKRWALCRMPSNPGRRLCQSVLPRSPASRKVTPLSWHARGVETRFPSGLGATVSSDASTTWLAGRHYRASMSGMVRRVAASRWAQPSAQLPLGASRGPPASRTTRRSPLPSLACSVRVVRTRSGK
jgi:hypothetical protein